MTILLIRSTIIYIAVVIAVRIMGKRQLGELKPHELVITILISSAATIPLQQNSIPLLNSLIPVLVFISLEIIQSTLSMKSVTFRNIFQGKPLFIIKDGILQQNEMKKIRFTMDDLIDALRQQEVFDISQVQNAIVETNGNLTVQKKSQYEPITPTDLKIATQQSTIPITIVMDGKMISEYFGNETIKESEISLVIKSSGEELKDIMLLTIDNNGNTYLIRKDNN
jgi:uncharacterized membrane protein YcaP (DUF421 family)